MKLIIASNNAHKIKEIKQILGGIFSEVISMKDAGINHETIEDGKTFLENAAKKARELSEISNCFAIADDSGLSVDALDGAPGIYSARFCGRHGDDDANNALLLEKLNGITDRKAHYTCAVALCTPSGDLYSAEGYLYGEILSSPRGNNGFGYDPLFFVPQKNQTVAELSSEEKNKISHRANALLKLIDVLKSNGFQVN